MTLISITPIYVGVKWWFFHSSRGEINPINSIFIGYSDLRIFFKMLALKTLVFIIKLAVSLPFIICILGISVLLKRINAAGGSNTGAIVLLIFLAILTVCFIVLAVYFSLNYCLVDYIYMLNPDMKIINIITVSTFTMHNNKGKIIKLGLSFLPWLALVIFVFPVFFISAYYTMSFTVLVNNIMKENTTLNHRNLMKMS